MEKTVKVFTKKQYLTVLKEAVENTPNIFEGVSTVPVKLDKEGNIVATMSTDLLLQFVEGEIETLVKRAANANSKPTKEQQENETFRVAILDSMVEGRLYSIEDVRKEVPECAEMHTAKISSLLTRLVNDGMVARVYDKRKTLYKLADRVEG